MRVTLLSKRVDQYGRFHSTKNIKPIPIVCACIITIDNSDSSTGASSVVVLVPNPITAVVQQGQTGY